MSAPLLASVLVSVVQSGDNLFPWGDHGGLVVETIDAEHGRQFVGTFSRFGWYHPGPTFFYLMAPLFWLLGKNPAGLNATVTLLNAASVALIVGVSWRRAGRVAALVAALAAAVLIARLGAPMLRDYWVPYSVILPFGAYVFVCAAVAAGDLVLLPLLLALGSFIAGNDLSCAPVVAGLALSSVVLYLVMRSLGAAPALGRRRFAWILGGSLLVIAALWALPIYDELHNHPGNITAIRHFFRTSHGEHTAAEGMAALAYVLKAYFWLPGKQFDAPAATAPAMVFLMLIIALLAVAVVVGVARRRSFGTMLAALSFIAMATEMVAVPNIRGALYGWLIFWLTALGPAIVAGIALTLGPELQGVGARIRLPKRVALVPALVAAVAVITTLNVLQLASRMSLRHDSEYTHSASLAPLYQRLDAWIQTEKVHRPFISIGTGIEWFDGAALASRRARVGTEFSVGGPPQGAFGKQHLPDDTEDADVWVRGTAEQPPAEFQVLGRTASMALFVHRRPAPE